MKLKSDTATVKGYSQAIRPLKERRRDLSIPLQWDRVAAANLIKHCFLFLNVVFDDYVQKWYTFKCSSWVEEV